MQHWLVRHKRDHFEVLILLTRSCIMLKNGHTYFRINKHNPIASIVHKTVKRTLKIVHKMVKHT